MSDPNAFHSSERQGAQYSSYQPAQATDQRKADLRAEQNEFMNYRFSPDELRVIKECEVESFYNRSLPFGLGLGTASFLAVRNGFLKGNAKFGPWPKVIAFSLFGYIAGRISYTQRCQEKMMALPNSRFAEMLRRNQQRRQGRNWDLGSQDAGAATALSLAPFQGATDSYSDDYNQGNSLNLDTNRPHYAGLDEYTPSMEGKNDLNEDLAIPTRKNTVTYDELRQKNRDEYAKNNYSSSNAGPATPTAPASPPAGTFNNPTPGPFSQPYENNDRRRANLRARSDDDFGGAQKTGPKNKYGDIWSE